MRVARHILTALTAVIAAGSSIAAQTAGPADHSRAVAAPIAIAQASEQAPFVAQVADQNASLAPFSDRASVGVHAQPADAPVPYAPPRREEHVGTNVLLMIVGGASLVTGAVVSGSASSTGARNAGDVLMIGGAVVGIIGLVRYLR